MTLKELNEKLDGGFGYNGVWIYSFDVNNGKTDYKLCIDRISGTLIIHSGCDVVEEQDRLFIRKRWLRIINNLLAKGYHVL